MTPSLWNRLESIDQPELNTLLESTVAVLRRAEGDGRGEIFDLPPRVLREELRVALTGAGVTVNEGIVETLVGSQKTPVPLAVALLEQVASQPVLAEEVERTFRARSGMMAIDSDTLMAGSLLVLMLKLKRIKIGNVDISFYDMQQGTLTAVRKFIGQ
jgi:hypothetical protein